ncbi:MAG TPA: hypothetical protein VGC15_11765 [Acetobacteraceae bacterium]
MAAYAAYHRACAACGVMQPFKDRRTCRLQTLFGTVAVEAPRFKLCRCRPSAPMAGTTVSPVCALLTARCTPKLERVQAELGARTSFRDAARVPGTLLPALPANQESVRIRTHAVALRIEADDRQAAAEVTAVRNEPDKAGVEDEHRPIVMLDGACIRAVPGHQTRNFEATCGKLEREGHHQKACEALGRIAGWAKDASVLDDPAMGARARRLVARCTELRAYIENNEGALIDYGQRHRDGKPISTSRAEGTVNQLVSARMNKRRQMRWSPRGAHRVLHVRAAVLDGRFGHPAIQRAA